MNDPLWETPAMIEAMGARPMGDLPAGITGLSIDSRTVGPGEAFFAIKGDRFDGHDFLTAASRGGCALAIVSEQKLPALGRLQIPLLVVDDVLASLERLAAAARARSRARIVAVTGSAGKTTTKEALRHALSASGTVHASVASFNNHWGVPLSLARLPAEAAYAVFEIGMNHPGEIRPLTKLVRPHVALITLIAPVHIGHFRDVDEIAEAKAEIFEGLVPEGTALLNADDPQETRLATLARKAGATDIRTFGESEGADYRLSGFEGRPDGSSFTAKIAGEDLRIELSVAGRHMAQNVVAVLGAVHLLGASTGRAATALRTWEAVMGRGARRRLALSGGGAIQLVDESYNANPASMNAALATLAALEPEGEGRRIAVLGDMLELGHYSRQAHAGLAPAVREARLSRLYLVGPEMNALRAELETQDEIEVEWHENAGELRESLLRQFRSGDIVMMKASNGIGLSRMVDEWVAGSAEQERGG